MGTGSPPRDSRPHFSHNLTYVYSITYTPPLVLGAVGFWADIRLALLVALIWAGHIGAYRAFGYGLKFESGFKDTHLSTQPAPIDAFTKFN